ncbi:hypothetical protein WL21_17365 [Burkholderia ubonensis]|nr:hypothetical protein WJ81_04225 [Burkholderia ubonensis]KVZ61166.1 hypothetical protein WL20_16475 [Burkholderia ubonensis]KVZ66803.1 hypothetical protein WL21_17365 [Burkholderia ubonensis]
MNAASRSTTTAAYSGERLLNNEGKDTSLMMTLDELEDVIDVVFANYNGEPHAGLGGRTPLEAMQFQLARGEEMLSTLPIVRRGTLCLFQEARGVAMRGNVSRGELTCPLQ